MVICFFDGNIDLGDRVLEYCNAGGSVCCWGSRSRGRSQGSIVDTWVNLGDAKAEKDNPVIDGTIATEEGVVVEDMTLIKVAITKKLNINSVPDIKSTRGRDLSCCM